MPTKRSHRGRKLNQRISERAIGLYMEGRPLGHRYFECLVDKRICPPTGTHCKDCTRFLELSRELCAELGLRPWEADPFVEGELHEELEKRTTR